MTAKNAKFQIKKLFKESILFKWWVILLSLCLGLLLGQRSTRIFEMATRLLNLFLTLFSMCSILVLGCLLLSTFGHKIERPFKNVLFPLLFKFTKVAVAVSALAIIVSFAFLKITGTNEFQKKLFSQAINEQTILNNKSTEVEYSKDAKIEKQSEFEQAILKIIPENIFYALTNGDVLKVLIFSIALGLVLGRTEGEGKESLMLIIDGILDACRFFINKLSLLCPFILFIFGITQSAQLKNINAKGIFIFITILIIIYFIVLLVASILMQKEVGDGYFKQFKYIKRSLLISLSVSDDIDCILLAIADLAKLKNDKKSKISLAVPVSFSLCSYGLIILLSATASYASVIYNSSFSPVLFFKIVILSILVSFSAIGLETETIYSGVSIMLSAIVLPSSTMLVMISTTMFLIIPIIHLVDVYINIILTLKIAKKQINS
ncbi:MAG: cation:dicarboxylase symporter family transporter [Oscillospiraceae bacterium]|nr:cation:dicarboxylase symporter family transporter [Oscillospiraceae bacterium]